MKRYINCIAHSSSDGNLLIGGESSALFDCGMAFCAKDTIQNVKNALAGRFVDSTYFLTGFAGAGAGFAGAGAGFFPNAIINLLIKGNFNS